MTFFGSADFGCFLAYLCSTTVNNLPVVLIPVAVAEIVKGGRVIRRIVGLCRCLWVGPRQAGEWLRLRSVRKPACFLLVHDMSQSMHAMVCIRPTYVCIRWNGVFLFTSMDGFKCSDDETV
jgi:hypothetical protein